MKQLIENRIISLSDEKRECLELLENNSYEENYITLRICYINERIRELQDLLDDVELMERENEK